MFLEGASLSNQILIVHTLLPLPLPSPKAHQLFQSLYIYYSPLSCKGMLSILKVSTLREFELSTSHHGTGPSSSQKTS